MATLTVTPTALGSYSCKVAGMTVVGNDIYHILHGLGATPYEVHFTVRSTGASFPVQLMLGSYDATMVTAYGLANLVGNTAGQADVFIRRTHTFIL